MFNELGFKEFIIIVAAILIIAAIAFVAIELWLWPLMAGWFDGDDWPEAEGD